MVGLLGDGTITDFILNPSKFMAALDGVSKTQNGTYLHTTAIILTALDIIAIAFATTMLFFNVRKLKINKSYIISSSMLIGGVVAVLLMALLMKDAKIFGSLFTIELNPNLGKDLAAVTATNPPANTPAEVFGVPVTCLDSDYTTFGMAAVSVLCIYSGAIITLLALEIKKVILSRK
jgi:hypothetical protein